MAGVTEYFPHEEISRGTAEEKVRVDEGPFDDVVLSAFVHINPDGEMGVDLEALSHAVADYGLNADIFMIAEEAKEITGCPQDRGSHEGVDGVLDKPDLIYDLAVDVVSLRESISEPVGALMGGVTRSQSLEWSILVRNEEVDGLPLVKLSAFCFGASITYDLHSSAVGGEDIAVEERCHDHLLAGHGGVVGVEGLLVMLEVSNVAKFSFKGFQDLGDLRDEALLVQFIWDFVTEVVNEDAGVLLEHVDGLGLSGSTLLEYMRVKRVEFLMDILVEVLLLFYPRVAPHAMNLTDLVTGHMEFHVRS